MPTFWEPCPGNRNATIIELPRRYERPADDPLRSTSPPMASTAIQITSTDGRRVIDWLLIFVNRAGLTAAVIAAVRADAVRGLRLVTVRAFAETDRLQRVVGTPLGRPR